MGVRRWVSSPITIISMTIQQNVAVINRRGRKRAKLIFLKRLVRAKSLRQNAIKSIALWLTVEKNSSLQCTATTIITITNSSVKLRSNSADLTRKKNCYRNTVHTAHRNCSGLPEKKIITKPTKRGGGLCRRPFKKGSPSFWRTASWLWSRRVPPLASFQPWHPLLKHC